MGSVLNVIKFFQNQKVNFLHGYPKVQYCGKKVRGVKRELLYDITMGMDNNKYYVVRIRRFILPKLVQRALHFTTSGRPIASITCATPSRVYTRLRALRRQANPNTVKVLSLSLARYSFTAGWTGAHLSSPLTHAERFLLSQLAFGTRTHDLVVGVSHIVTNHLAIATRTDQWMRLPWFLT